MDNKIKLYKVVRDVKCIKCNSNGAIQGYGTYDETIRSLLYKSNGQLSDYT